MLTCISPFFLSIVPFAIISRTLTHTSVPFTQAGGQIGALITALESPAYLFMTIVELVGLRVICKEPELASFYIAQQELMVLSVAREGKGQISHCWMNMMWFMWLAEWYGERPY